MPIRVPIVNLLVASGRRKTLSTILDKSLDLGGQSGGAAMERPAACNWCATANGYDALVKWG
jgi:hypothetical protein